MTTESTDNPFAGTKLCRSCGEVKSLDEYYKATGAPDGHKSICKTCWKAGDKSSTTPRGPRASRARLSHAREMVTETGYVASPRLLSLINTVRVARLSRDGHPLHLMFIGPSGSGKTAAAEHVAYVLDLPFTKVDCPSMVDAESWFGTREIVAEHGVAVTRYTPSDFVKAITSEGVLFLDEINRVDDRVRQVLLGLLDGTHRVTNPLTGEIVEKHPGCYVVMAGNRGLQFTGTFPIDPAFMTRSLVERFDYLDVESEVRVAIDRTGCTDETARLFVRFATEIRQLAATEPEVIPMSTREVLAACALVARGMDVDDAAQVAVINAASDEGAEQSVAFKITAKWTGIRPASTKFQTVNS
jgi:MoxR-like ATPase